jgi:ABC-2 type transport system permease protein
MSRSDNFDRAWRIASKELLQTRRDRLAALFTIILPVVFTIFLGLIIGSGNGDTHIPIAVADQDGTAASQQFLQQLAASPLLKLQTTAPDKLDTAVEDQKMAAALIIPKGFGATTEQAAAPGGGSASGAAAPDPPVAPSVTLTFIRIETSTGAQSVSQAIQTAVSDLNARLLATRVAAEQTSAALSGGGSPPASDLAASAQALVNTALASPAVSLKTVAADAGSGSAVEGASGFVIASTGSLVQWVLFSLLSVATGVAWERRRGLLRRLAAAGVSGRTIIEGRMMGMMIITFLQQVMLVLLGAIAFGVGYFNSPGALLMTMISLSALAACVGLLISALFRSEPAVIATTVISAQLLAVLGGAWFPLEVTSATFSRVAHFFPSAWIMDSLHGIVLKGWGVGNVLAPLGYVWIWIVVLFAVAVWRFRPE